MSQSTALLPNTNDDYDLIVIGSGMGSLATASLMATVGGQRVLVLEAGRKLGGFLHTFRRGPYQWEPGVHYVSGMEDGNLNRRCMDLVTGGKARWHKIGDPLENLFFPEGNFKMHADPKAFERDLIDRFPAEARAIKRYFKDMKRLLAWSTRWYISKQFPDWLAERVSFGRKLASRNTQEYLDELFDDAFLKAILTAQWPDFGTPPHESALGFHAIVATAFYSGGYYPIGGPDSMITGAVEQIEARGGSCLRGHRVEEILIEDNQAYGVRVSTRSGIQEFFAPTIVSGAGVVNTFQKMVPDGYGEIERAKAAQAIPGTSSVNLFLGLKDDPAKHGFRDCNYWMYRTSTHVRSATQPGELPIIDGAYLSFGSMRDPQSTSHTAQIVTFSDHSDWADFGAGEWKERGDKYEKHKAAIIEQLLDFVEQYTPGLRDLIDHQELASPLTIKSFLDHPHGQMYGRACTPERLGANEFNVGTSVQNLHVTGTDLVNPGIDSALMVGVMTASKLLGPLGMPRVMTRAFTTDYDDIKAVTPVEVVV